MVEPPVPKENATDEALPLSTNRKEEKLNLKFRLVFIHKIKTLIVLKIAYLVISKGASLLLAQ